MERPCAVARGKEKRHKQKAVPYAGGYYVIIQYCGHRGMYL